MNDLEKYFRENNKKQIHKWIHYFDIYERHFSRFRNEEISVLEIGIYQGGSLQMWKNYFGGKAKIYGIDINPKCKELEEENIKIFIGSQSDRDFLKKIKQSIPKIDILIDDGGHKFIQQIVTYEELFDHVKDDGVYLCEDLLTSYQMVLYGGGHKRNGTFIEYSKNFIDFLNAYHSEQKSLKVTAFTKSVDSIHYYDSVIVIEKRKREKPHTEMTGTVSFQEKSQNQENEAIKFVKGIGFHVVYGINIFLRFFKLGSFYWR
ncbi:MAG: hypothetical protein Q7J35_15010 [Candidatus Methanoperedens sp.]|nr:hypothetical protein [Candidatus Methanoperedens sp.]